MRVKPLIAIPLIAVALAGCSTEQPAPKETTAAADQKPLFASDEEALAAAQAALRTISRSLTRLQGRGELTLRG